MIVYHYNIQGTGGFRFHGENDAGFRVKINAALSQSTNPQPFYPSNLYGQHTAVTDTHNSNNNNNNTYSLYTFRKGLQSSTVVTRVIYIIYILYTLHRCTYYKLILYIYNLLCIVYDGPIIITRAGHGKDFGNANA